jgi:coenzyme PQQ precursor peptide PqqA
MPPTVCLFRSAQKDEIAPTAGGRTMWKKPRIIEIAVGLEINSYACAVTA